MEIKMVWAREKGLLFRKKKKKWQDSKSLILIPDKRTPAFYFSLKSNSRVAARGRYKDRFPNRVWRAQKQKRVLYHFYLNPLDSSKLYGNPHAWPNRRVGWRCVVISRQISTALPSFPHLRVKQGKGWMLSKSKMGDELMKNKEEGQVGSCFLSWWQYRQMLIEDQWTSFPLMLWSSWSHQNLRVPKEWEGNSDCWWRLWSNCCFSEWEVWKITGWYQGQAHSLKREGRGRGRKEGREGEKRGAKEGRKRERKQ